MHLASMMAVIIFLRSKMEQFNPKRIENFNLSNPFHCDMEKIEFNKQYPLFYLVTLTKKFNGIQEIYFVNLRDEELNYLALGSVQSPEVIYYDIKPNEAVKIFEYHLINDADKPITQLLWLSTRSYKLYKINIFDKHPEVPSFAITWQKIPVDYYPLVLRAVENPKDLPLSPRVLEYRRNWHKKLIKQYGKPLADFMVAVNDMLYRYDFLPSFLYAYGMDLYDEWTCEAVDIAGTLAVSYKELDYIKVERIIKEVFVEWCGWVVKKELQLSEDGVNEIIEAFSHYKKQTKTRK